MLGSLWPALQSLVVLPFCLVAPCTLLSLSHRFVNTSHYLHWPSLLGGDSHIPQLGVSCVCLCVVMFVCPLPCVLYLSICVYNSGWECVCSGQVALCAARQAKCHCFHVCIVQFSFMSHLQQAWNSKCILMSKSHCLLGVTADKQTMKVSSEWPMAGAEVFTWLTKQGQTQGSTDLWYAS